MTRLKDRAAQLKEIDPLKVRIIAEVEDTVQEALVKVSTSPTLVYLRNFSTQHKMRSLRASGRDMYAGTGRAPLK